MMYFILKCSKNPALKKNEKINTELYTNKYIKKGYCMENIFGILI